VARTVSDEVLGALAEARALGLLGPGPLDHHVASAERFATALEHAKATGPAFDLGSGGGVPGLVLAEWFPEWEWVLFDAHRRRTSFLVSAVARLGLSRRVSVVRERAEVAGHSPDHRERYGVVTARSFGPPAATAEAAAAFVAVGGVVAVAEPPDSVGRWNGSGLGSVGLAPHPSTTRGVCVLRKERSLAAEYPRPVKVQRSAPLF
jgi:16S rRNA (guanine527-N7)-methyltransferase